MLKRLTAFKGPLYSVSQVAVIVVGKMVEKREIFEQGPSATQREAFAHNTAMATYPKRVGVAGRRHEPTNRRAQQREVPTSRL